MILRPRRKPLLVVGGFALMSRLLRTNDTGRLRKTGTGHLAKECDCRECSRCEDCDPADEGGCPKSGGCCTPCRFYTVISGVSDTPPATCHAFAGAGSADQIEVADVINDTHCLQQSPGDACSWSKTISGGMTGRLWDEDNCQGNSSPFSWDINITLSRIDDGSCLGAAPCWWFSAESDSSPSKAIFGLSANAPSEIAATADVCNAVGNASSSLTGDAPNNQVASGGSATFSQC